MNRKALIERILCQTAGEVRTPSKLQKHGVFRIMKNDSFLNPKNVDEGEVIPFRRQTQAQLMARKLRKLSGKVNKEIPKAVVGLAGLSIGSRLGWRAANANNKKKKMTESAYARLATRVGRKYREFRRTGSTNIPKVVRSVGGKYASNRKKVQASDRLSRMVGKKLIRRTAKTAGAAGAVLGARKVLKDNKRKRLERQVAHEMSMRPSHDMRYYDY